MFLLMRVASRHPSVSSLQAVNCSSPTVNAGSESSRKKAVLHHLAQCAGLDFYQVLNLHGIINCKRVLPGYAISECESWWVHIFVFPVNCAWLPLFGFLPYTDVSWALQPGLTQSLRSCRQGEHPPAHHLQATKVLSKATVFLNYLTPSAGTDSHVCQKKGLVHK